MRAIGKDYLPPSTHYLGGSFPHARRALHGRRIALRPCTTASGSNRALAPRPSDSRHYGAAARPRIPAARLSVILTESPCKSYRTPLRPNAGQIASEITDVVEHGHRSPRGRGSGTGVAAVRVADTKGEARMNNRKINELLNTELSAVETL